MLLVLIARLRFVLARTMKLQWPIAYTADADDDDRPHAGFEVNENLDLVGEDADADGIPRHPIDENPRFASAHIYSALRDRARAIAGGAGRRFRVRTQRGFLNVHTSPDDPYRTDNLVRAHACIHTRARAIPTTRLHRLGERSWLCKRF